MFTNSSKSNAAYFHHFPPATSHYRRKVWTGTVRSRCTSVCSDQRRGERLPGKLPIQWAISSLELHVANWKVKQSKQSDFFAYAADRKQMDQNGKRQANGVFASIHIQLWRIALQFSIIAKSAIPSVFTPISEMRNETFLHSPFKDWR